MALAINPHTVDYLPSIYHEKMFDVEPTTTADKIESILPGFPAQYTGERVWVGSTMALKQDEWMLVLSEQDQAEIQKALRHFQSLNLPPGFISPTTFPLPQELHGRLKSISYDCYNGRGFAVLRGLKPESFTDDENVLIFAGVSSHVAPKRGFQDVKRELVTCHVYSQDTKPGAKEHNLKPAFTNGRLAFHTDLGDILTLYAKNVSATDGETMIASSSQIFNELAATRPDFLQELAKDWTFYQSQNYEKDRTPLITNTRDNQLIFQFSRLPITGFRTTLPNPTLPIPTALRFSAMAHIESLARKNAFSLPRQSGDVAFINNMCLMHARNAFDLDKEGEPLPSKRHLVKLMLRDPELAWKLPERLQWLEERIYGANREGGTREERWQLSVGTGEGSGWAGDGSYANG